MDLPALSTFVAVAECASFSRASERLFMTQPAVSKRVAALEADLGVRVFDRLGRQVRLTEAGELFLVSARRILSDLATSREAVRSLGTRVTGRLRLATSHHIGIHRLPPVLRAFTRAYPEVELDLLFMDSEQACADVAAGSLELAIVTLPRVDDPRLDTRLIWPDRLAVVASHGHPLGSDHGNSLIPEDLIGHAAVLPGQGTVTRTILLDALAKHRVEVQTTLETNYLETIKMMVSVGLGWSVLPDTMIDDSIVELPIDGLEMQRELGTVRLAGRTLSRAAQALLASLDHPPQPPRERVTHDALRTEEH